MYEKRLYGATIPTTTPMNEDGSIDDIPLVNFIWYLLGAGANVLYPNGTDGESLPLIKGEGDHVAEVMTNVNAHRLPLSIRRGSMITGETASHTVHAANIGVDGIGIMGPAFFQMDGESLLQYYRGAIKGLPENFPVYIYNIPGCMTNDAKPGLLQKSVEGLPNIVGIKHSSPDLMWVEDYPETDGRRPELLIGCDSLFLQCLMTGGIGTVIGPGNILYERSTRLYRQYQQGDYIDTVMTQKKIVEMDRKLAGTLDIPVLKILPRLRDAIRVDVRCGLLRLLKEDEKRTLEEVYDIYCEKESIREQE